jgi:ABC-type transport system involved in cytochrome bd biosynthesis fused ATPase/permease subunit
MKKDESRTETKSSETKEMVEQYYKRVMRILEYYVLLCFILVTFIPLLKFGWVPAFVKLIYFTGFPLLILIFIISLFKNPLQNMIERLLAK